MSRAKITIGRAGYYTEVVAKGLDDYLSGAGEAPGVWAGAGTAFESVVGLVGADQMQRLFEPADPCHPVTGNPLGASYAVRDGVDKVSGWDLTLSAPKSFSTLWAVADTDLRRTLDSCQSAAVEASITYLEEHGAFSRKGHAGRFQVDTHGLMIARFDHRTSRAGDPQRHSHLLVSNRVRCLDGQWRALDSRALHAQLKAAGVVYHAALRAETTTRVGVRWGLTDRNGQADIDDVSTELVGRWSTRRNDVARRATERIAVSEEALGRELTLAERRREFAQATLDTRPPKTTIDRDIHERWRDEARDIGCDPARWVEKAVGHRAVDEVGLEGLGGMALEDMAEARSTWSRADLVVAVGALIPPQAAATGDGTREVIEQLVAEVLRDRRVVTLTPVDWSGSVPLRRDGFPVDHSHNNVRYSTTATIAAEVEVLDFAHRGVTDRAAVEPAVVEAAFVDSSLSTDQRIAVERITTDGASLSTLVGPAGTGKTTTIAAAADVWREAGHTVRGVAVSAVAADVLGAELGVRADTVAKLLWENRRPNVRPNYRVSAGEVVIVDEASMVTSKQFAQLTRLVEGVGAKIVAVGDYRQLGAVDAGGLFHLLAKDGRAAELTGVWRFRNEWEQAASLKLRDGDRSVTADYHHAGRIHRGEGESTLDAMVNRWATHIDPGRSVVMLAPRCEDAEVLSVLAREHLVRRGVLAAAGQVVDGQTIGVGDQIVTLRNDRRTLTDTGNWVRNGDRWTVTETSTAGGLRVESAQRGTAILSGDYVAEHVALGYALTVHKAQGMTVDHSIVLVDDTTSAEALYVGMTRGRDSNQAWVRTESPGDDHLTVFGNAVGRDTTEVAAVGYLAGSDDRGPEEVWADLTARVRDVMSGNSTPRYVPLPVRPAEVEIDGGIDIGW